MDDQMVQRARQDLDYRRTYARYHEGLRRGLCKVAHINDEFVARGI